MAGNIVHPTQAKNSFAKFDRKLPVCFDVLGNYLCGLHNKITKLAARNNFIIMTT
jgi:hypothetical protein